MPHVYSTATAGIDYTDYMNVTKDLNQPVRKVTIHGGTNVANKVMVTPLGVATPVTDEELAFLMGHPLFKTHLEKGFMKVRESKEDPEKVAADMNTRDESAPLVPEDFEADNDKSKLSGPKLGKKK